jgi:hypothetical protein
MGGLYRREFLQTLAAVSAAGMRLGCNNGASTAGPPVPSNPVTPKIRRSNAENR